MILINRLVYLLPYIFILIFPLPIPGLIKGIVVLGYFIISLSAFKNKKKYKIVNILLSVVFFIIYMLLQYKIVGGSIESLLPFLYGLLVLLFIPILVDKNNINLLFQSMYRVNHIVIIISFFEIITGVYLFQNNPVFTSTLNQFGQHYALSVFWNVNNLAYYLLFATPLSLYFCLAKGKKKIVVFYLISMTYLILLNTESILGLMCLTLILVGWRIQAILTRITFIRLFIFTFICSGLIAIFGLYHYEFFDFIQSTMYEDFFIKRVNILYQTHFIASQYFPYGGGLGINLAVQGIPPHNLFYLIFSELGLIALIIFSYIWLAILFEFCRLSFLSKDQFNMPNLILTMWILFLISNMLPAKVESEYITWIFIGTVIALLNLSKSPKKFFLI